VPNFCRNNVTISSDNVELIKKFELSLNSDGLFEYFKPNPNGTWDYAWSVENWGVKWDVRGDEISVVQIDNDRIIIEFDTAWGPPIQFFEELEEQGYEVYAMYDEPGLAFCGIYTNGDEDHYEYGEMNSQLIKDVIPDDLDECFMISELAEEREQEELDS
jgi:hypothetical protein